MEFKKLPSNSKKLLEEIVKSENPVQMLCNRFESASGKEDEELRGMLKELREEGFIIVDWASNKPYRINICQIPLENIYSYKTGESFLSSHPIAFRKMRFSL